MSADETARILFGTDESVSPNTALRAGPLDVAYRAGKLGPIRLGEVEIWHGVTFTYRDPDWGTPDLIVASEDMEAGADEFRIAVAGTFPTVPPIDVVITIQGESDGHIRFAGEAVPRGAVPTSRLGLCLLHPMAAGGRRVAVGHEDGRRSESTLPVLVPSWPPFMLVRSVRHEYADDAWATADLAGDVFELEDQRNNSDPSFKTYSRSNLMPRPYGLLAGTPIRHVAELRLDGPAPSSAQPRQGRETVVVQVTGAKWPMPRLGVAISPADAASPDAARDALLRLRPSHLHLTLWPDGPAVDFAGVAALLALSVADLRLDVVETGPEVAIATLDRLAVALSAAGIVPESVALFPSGPGSIERARALFPGARIGGGTPYYFAQANRLERLGSVDFVSFTSSPLVHGAEDDAVMLSLLSLPSLCDTLRVRHPGVPIRIGPSAIAVRRSPLGGQPVTDGMRRMALAGRDPRSRALFGAAWALGYWAQALRSGVEALTLGSLSRETGLCESGPDGDLRLLPAGRVLSRLSDRPTRAFDVASSSPGRLAALAFEAPGGCETLLANLTGTPVDVAIEGWLPEDVAILDAASCGRLGDGWAEERSRFAAPSLRLQAYAVASLRGSAVTPPSETSA